MVELLMYLTVVVGMNQSGSLNGKEVFDPAEEFDGA